MKIKTIALGNESEAFIENRLTDGLNIIFSDDNNRGKTLVLQGLMYSLGYDSIFPNSFDKEKYYYYSEVDFHGKTYEFLRKKNSGIVKTGDHFYIFNSISELKHYFDRNILKLPRITKDANIRLVDLSLLYETFFVGQDERSASGLISSGQFNKMDFKNMLYSLAGIALLSECQKDEEAIKEKRSQLQNELRLIRKKITILKQAPDIAQLVSKTADSEAFHRKKEKLASLEKQMAKKRNERRREENRKNKLVSLLGELRSLNRNINEGTVICSQCGSTEILYKSNELAFEVSNKDVREKILTSIEANIAIKIDLIDECTLEIHALQNTLNQELSEIPATYQQAIVYQDQISSDQKFDQQASSLKMEIDKLSASVTGTTEKTEKIKDSQKALHASLIKKHDRDISNH